MLKLSKAQLKEVSDAKEAIDQALSELNALTRHLNELCEGYADAAQEYFDGKSEAWQESDKGQNYEAWIEALRVEIDELETSDVLDQLDDYPEKPE